MSEKTQALLIELDVLHAGFSRQDPDPMIVALLRRLIDDRRLFLMGWVRQGLLSRCADERQLVRAQHALSGFPDVPLMADDHVHAARREHHFRGQGLNVQPVQALFWVVAERIGAAILTNEAKWLSLIPQGAPVVRPAALSSASAQ